MKIKHLSAYLLLCICVSAPAAPFSISADGEEVTDTKTGLIWRRCAEGMSFGSGTCTGVANTFTHEAALTHASAQASAVGGAWRLPNVKELSSIVDKNRNNPAIDPVVFPATPSEIFWSSSAHRFDPIYPWWVFFNSGDVDKYFHRGNAFYVRLVRAGQ